MKLKKYVGFMLAAVLCVSALAGCSSSSKKETETTTTETDGKTLRIAFPDMVTTTDPANVSAATMLKEVAGVCETLVYADSDFKLQPMLATEWEQTGDTTWEFKLRDDVTFHDGTKFNADAVKWCLERERDENSAFKGSTFIDSVDVVDEYTIRINTTQPTTELPGAVSYVGTAIVAPTSVDENGEFVKAIGTGCFMQTDFDVTSGKFTCEKYDGYWGDVNTSVTSRVITCMTDASARSLALQNGEVDIVSDIPFSDLETLSNSDEFKVSKFNTARTYYYEYNMNKPVFQDERVRKALIYAINKEEIVNDVLLGVGGVPEGMLMSDIPWANTDVDTYDYDPEKAVELLKEAGYTDTDGDGFLDKDGEKLSIKIISFTKRPGCQLIVQATQGYFANIGIDTSIEIMDWSAMAELVKNGEYDMTLNSAASCYMPSPTYYLNNVYVNSDNGYHNDKVDELVNKCLASKDTEEKYELSKEAQAIAQEDAGIYTVALYGAVFGLSKGVTNFEYNAAAHDFIVPNNTDLM